MSPPRNRPSCQVCSDALVKNGKTSAGRTRWRCRGCGSSALQQREDVSRRAELDWFHSWLLRGQDQQELAGSSRSFRRRTQWCWRIEIPPPIPTGEIHEVVMVDGTYFQNWCVLIATDGHHVLDWQWCNYEKKIAWSQILQRWPAPTMLVTDGGTGLHAAARDHWPMTRVQRCYFHIFQTVRRHTTLRPRLDPGKQILQLTRALMKVRNLDQAASWMGAYATWEAHWDEFLRHRTYARAGAIRPTDVPLERPYWYTHRDLRRVRGLFRKLIANDNLFAWLELAHCAGQPLPRTTSPLEGGPNAAIKRLLRDHRGMPTPHARRAVAWLLDSLTATPRDPWTLARPEHWNPPPRRPAITPDPEPGPTLGNSFSWEDGNGIQRGWAGRPPR